MSSPRSNPLPLILATVMLTLASLLPGVWTSSAMAGQVESIPLADGTPAGEPVVTLTASKSSGMTLTLEIPSIDIATVDIAGRTFTDLEFQNGGHRGEDGQPSLPTITRLVSLPPGSGVAVSLLERDLVRLDDLVLAPNLPIMAADQPSLASFDPDWYAASGASEATVLVGEPALLHGLPVVPVTFSPVAHDPLSGRTEVARRMTVEVSFEGHDDRTLKTVTRTMIPESFADLFEREVVGYVRGDDVHVGPGSYIMICPNNVQVVSAVSRLADWRRRQGYNVLVVTTATTGTTNNAIKSWLEQQYETLDPPLEFVTLVGDANGSIAIPTFNENYSYYNGEGDHLYTTLDGPDVLSDIHLGRLSVTSLSELEMVVDKIVDYETNPDLSNTQWFTAAGLTGDPSTSGASCIFVNQFVKAELLKLNYTRIDTIWTSPFLSQMMGSINQGETLFTYRGYLNMSGMSSSHIMTLSNGQKLPFAVIMTCGTGDFQSQTNCRSEAFLRAPNGGGIGAIGTATIGTNTRYNNCMFLGVTNGVIDSADHRMGPALTRGKLNVYKNYFANEWQKVWVWSTWNNLMGDPVTEIYTAVPAQLVVDYPEAVSLGANALPVTVTHAGAPVPGARVAVYQAGQVRDVAYADESGQAVLSIAGATDGDVLVTVTGTNLLAYQGQTAVGNVNRSLDFNALSVQEITGNGDGLANPGEEIDLLVQLRNPGISSVLGAVATLSSTVPQVTVLEAVVEYGTVPAGGTVWGTFRVQIAADAPGGVDAALHLEASGSGQTWLSLVDLPVHGPRASLGTLAFSGPGGDLDPGESGIVSFDLSNVGDLATTGVTGTLTCDSPWVSVVDAEGSWGPVTSGGSIGQFNPFSIAIAAECFPGYLTNLTVTLAFAEGGIQVVDYPVTIGTAGPGDPTGPCAYGYWAIDDTDDTPFSPTYDWVEVTLVGTNTGINDTHRHDDETRSFDLPFPFTYYGETYERVSICSNGWLSFGDTYLVLYRNWTMPADGSPDAMIAAFWTDLAGGQVFTYHDTVQHRYIVQWEGFGSYNSGSYSGNCTFQIILHDPAYHATDTGDGLVVIQYKNVTNYAPPPETNYFTTGIQDHTREVGLTYAYGNNYAGGGSTIQPGRAIAFRPLRSQVQGTLRGEVRNASAGGLPVPGATVTVLGAGRQLATAEDGRYQGGVPAGLWDVAVYHDSFAPDTTYGVTIRENEVTVADFDLMDIRGPYIVGTTQIDDTEDTAGPYLVQSTITDLSGVQDHYLHYTSSTQGGPFTLPLTVVDAASGLVEASIPGQPDGTRVQYWITASDIVGNGSRDPENAPWPPYHFMVSEVTVIEDGNCESPDGWIVNLDGNDTATTGIWEHGDPVGTWSSGGQPVQPDDDHTPAPGVNCWFTGQHVAGQDVGYNDVDSGHTTVTSPIYPVSGYGTVSVEYYRWFTNDQGNNPGQDPWTVDISNDGGQSWTNLESTLVSNNSWQPVSFVLNDYFPSPNQLRLRFRAEDYDPGSLVEAAVDDLRITGSTVVADLLPPTVTVTGPAGGSQFAPGHTMLVTWNAQDDVGVVHSRVWLSLDGGQTYDWLLGEGPLAGSLAWTVEVPDDLPSYACRVRVEVLDAMQQSAVAASASDFYLIAEPTSAPLPRHLALAQNHPNPFNPQTVIAFELPRAQPVQLRIYDLQGKLVRNLVQGLQPAGRHEVVWQGRDERGSEVASGLYFYRLTTEDGDQVRKMTLLK
jgi:hypothetical protein